jgi:hypothetical protein
METNGVGQEGIEECLGSSQSRKWDVEVIGVAILII